MTFPDIRTPSWPELGLLIYCRHPTIVLHVLPTNPSCVKYLYPANFQVDHLLINRQPCFCFGKYVICDWDQKQQMQGGAPGR